MMSLIDPVPETRQRAASRPDASVWVNASAGSGKTTVLTNRVLRLLLQGVPPQRILCLTFTRAAAAEMALRITAKLSQWATCDDDELRGNLDNLQGHAPTPQQLTTARRLFAQVLSCPGGMHIRTIHAFGQEVLRRFPVEAGLPPHFTVIEDDDARALQHDALTDLLRQMPESSPPHASTRGGALNHLVCELGEKGFVEAMQDVLVNRARVENAVAESGGLKNLIARLRLRLGIKEGETTESIRRAGVDNSVLPQNDMRRAATWLLEGSKDFSPRGKVMLAWLELSPENRADSFDDYCSCFLKKTGEPFAKLANKDLLEKYPEIDTLLCREAARLQAVRERIEVARMAETTAALLVFGLELIKQYQKRKAVQAALDYDDLIIHTDALLRRPGIAPWILYKLDGGLDHILVDEAQDTSHAQWRIIQALADDFFSGSSARTGQNRTLFVVGDEKQSIFSFQNADPESFTAMRQYFGRRIASAEKAYDEVPLHTSFRSAPAILRAVDAVFAVDHVRFGVSVEPVLHQAFDRKKIGHVEVWPLIPMSRKNDAEDGAWEMPGHYEKEHDPQAIVSATIADKIKTWLLSGEILVGENRPVAAGDIMILLRRRGRFADLMVRALKERAVPVTGVDRMRLVKQLPVMDLLALMQFALLPEDDLNLAAVLRGPLLGLDEDQLMTLAIERKDTLWRSLSGNPAFAVAHDYLLRWLNAADLMNPFAMLAYILDEPCPGSAISGRRAMWSRLGPDALDPIDELLNEAQNFSHRHAPSLQSFLHWLMATEAEIKREMDRGGGQVRIMTVHAAKGLEAPIVFLPDTANTPRMQNVPKFLWDATGIPLYVARKPASGVARDLWDVARRRQMEEYRRLLYVALTRAANRLYIGGWEQGRGESGGDESWYGLVTMALKPLHEVSADRDQEIEGSITPIIVFSDPELKSVPKKSAAKSPKDFLRQGGALPAWTRRTAQKETLPPIPVTPSRFTMAPVVTTVTDKTYARGRIIHRLLQSLPEMEFAKRDAAAARFLANPQHGLTPDQQTEIKAEVIDLLNHPDFAPLFGADSRAEVPLVGYIGPQPVSGQVDRMCLREDVVWIVDYKTNRTVPENAEVVPEAYRRQLAEYRAIMQDIYPTKTIRCFLLWTCGPKLMEISEAISHGVHKV